MADIRTRQEKNSTIKTLDKAFVMAGKIKHSYVGTKELMEKNERRETDSPAGYAVGKVSSVGNYF